MPDCLLWQFGGELAPDWPGAVWLKAGGSCHGVAKPIPL